jgi:hypothetical protein
MQNRPRGDYSSDEAVRGDSGVRIVHCPHCKDDVPLSIYCLKCGYPMFELMKEHMSEDGSDGDEVSDGHPPDEGEEFRLEPEDLEPPQSEDVEAESKPEEESEAMNVDTQESAEPKEPMEEISEKDPPENVDTPDRDEGEVAAPAAETQLDEADQGYEPDEPLKDLMRNLANSINMKLWSVGQLLEGRISEQNFERLHEGYDARWRQLMDQRKERLTQARDLNSLEEGLERAYISLGELEIKKTLNDLFEGEHEAKAPAYEWEISHCERQLEGRRGEIAFLERLSNVVPRDELAKMTERAKGYLDRMRSSEGLTELISGTYARLKTSMEEIVAFLEENE